ncbi:MAG: maltose alpha-D-glucosyltransferase [Elusimicrobia bacterium]|nr:maltose alpha-D-glucosyltransferase [Elusimicrobiota bacterium]
MKSALPADDALWYKDAVVYELHVRTFFDSNADGVGDFKGLTQKLDYLKDLGVTALWLLPFYPSPLKDDGYDIADYRSVHPAYGTLKDFKVFLREAHRRGLRVITELIINHTSNQHAWFRRARRAKPRSRLRDFYVWSDTPEKYRDARIIFKDFEPSNWSWDSQAKAYYWHRFYSHQPDLNFDNPAVLRAIFQVLDFWLELGVDGMRLDAVPYLFEREGTPCENLPETHAFLKELRRHVDGKYKNRMLLAEANQWPEDAVAYFGSGDECHMNFHFPLMPRLFMATRMEDRTPIVDILKQTPPIPETCQWALFLRNHDEMTLEMVTDEDRDYMYSAYAQDPQARINLGIRRRLAPLLGNQRRKIELLNGLLFALPGTPVLYYGDEIGMGDNIYLGDRNGVRTPMQWSTDRNAGFSRGNPQKLVLPTIIDPEYHYEALNVEAQQSNPHSLLWWMKRLAALRKSHKSFSRGSIEFLHPDNHKVIAFIRRYGGETILVAANLSRFVQCVELDLKEVKGAVPVEMFGRTEFPPVGDLPYFLTLGPHSFYWFVLQTSATASFAELRGPGGASGAAALSASGSPQLPVLAAEAGEIYSEDGRLRLESLLPTYLKTQRWFAGKARRLKSVKVVEAAPFSALSGAAAPANIVLVQAHFNEGEADTYLLPLAAAWGERGEEALRACPEAAVARLKGEGREGLLFDALKDADSCKALFDAITRRRRFKGAAGTVEAYSSEALAALSGNGPAPLEPSPLKAEQSNSSVVFGGRFILKLIRRFEYGVNPELEFGRFLTDKMRFAHAPPLAGAIEYRGKDGRSATLAVLQGYTVSEGDAWRFTLDALGRYFEQILSQDLRQAATELKARELIGTYVESARLLGRRTAELHGALSSDPEDPAFSPESFTEFDRKSLYHGMVSHAEKAFRLLRQRIKSLPPEAQPEAGQALERSAEIQGRFQAIRDRKISSMRIRCHGDYHLGQVLYTGKDFVIIDFEGEPDRPLSWRRIKRSALRDVAGMLRSFDYAACAALMGHSRVPAFRPEDALRLQPWAGLWSQLAGAAFLSAYREAAGAAPFLPRSAEEFDLLLDVHLLEKAVYELRYELNHRPAWAHIPLRGILKLLNPRRQEG